MSRRITWPVLCLLAATMHPACDCAGSDIMVPDGGPSDGATGRDGESQDAETPDGAVDGGIEDGGTNDASLDDGGTEDGGMDSGTPLRPHVVSTAGGGSANSEQHRLRLQVGAPQPNGVMASENHRLRVAP